MTSAAPEAISNVADLAASRLPLEVADSHPLLLDAVPETSSPTIVAVNRPIWAQHSELVAQSGPSRYFDLKGLHERLESAQGATSPLRTRHATDGFDSDVSSARIVFGSSNATDVSADDPEERATDSVCRPDFGYDTEDDSTAELAAVLARNPHSLAGAGRQLPPLAAPQARSRFGPYHSSRSASQTPQAVGTRQTRASSRASLRQGASSPFGRTAAEARQIGGPPSALAAVGDPEDDDLDALSVELMAAMHKMPDSELHRHLFAGGAPAIGHREKRFEAAAAMSSPLARHSADPDPDAADDTPSTPKAAPFPPWQAQLRTNALIRSLSRALAEALRDATKARASAIKERAKHQEAVEYMNQQHYSRESALKELCLQHGIKEGEISRCLLRAPVLDAEATKKRNSAQGHSITTSKTVLADSALDIPTGGGAIPAAKDRKTSDEPASSLPQSLQEAMLEDLDGFCGSSASVADDSTSISTLDRTSGGRDRSPSVASFRTEASAASISRLRRADGRFRGSHADLRAEISSISSSSRSPVTATSPGHPSKPTRPPAVRSSSSASTKYRAGSTTGLGEWASGLMPWAASGTSRKAAASTASSNVKATSPGRHTISEGLLADEPDPFETPTKSKSTTALPEQEMQASDSTAPSQDDPAAKHVRTRSASVPRADAPETAKPSPRSGYGILGTLAWRRKKPSAEPSSRPRDSGSDADATRGHREEDSSETVKSHQDSGTSIKTTAASATSDPPTEVSDPATGGCGQGYGPLKEVDIERPVAIRRSSSKSMPVALHEAIGSEPTSPITERLQAQLGLPPGALPKPSHFKAVFLATRIMTPDASSLLYDSGKKTSELIASLAMSLVGRARDEGKLVEEPAKPAGGRRASGLAPRPASIAHAMLTHTAEGHAKRIVSAQASPLGHASSEPKPSSSSTFARAFGRYTRSPVKDDSGRPVEPNVTRLPDMYRYTAANAPAPAGPGRSGPGQDAESPSGLNRPPAAAVELEAIVPSEAAPPTLAKVKHKKGRKTKRKGTMLRPSRTLPSASPRPGRLDPLDEESSGDEFEVYGGKGLARGYGYSEDEEDDDGTADEEDEEAELLTDRYGFIYDATSADIRLLRQARKAATPAPACLTGIRVGVRARGGTDSQSEEEKEDPDFNELDTEDETAETEAVEAAMDRSSSAGAADEAEAASESESLATTANTSAPSEGGDSTSAARSHRSSSSKGKKSRNTGLLSLSHSKPVAEALSVSVTSQPSTTTKLDRTAPDSNDVGEASNRASSPPDAPRSHANQNVAGGALAKPTATSQTVRRLLSQLQDMHDAQQTTHKAKWDQFLQRRRERLSRAHLDSSGGGGGSASGSGSNGSGSTAHSQSHARRGSTSLQVRSGAAGLSSFEKAPEEDWSQGMVGINRMGASKAGKEDWKQFLSLCQAGIPLCYRAKIWAECSGANEVHEPGRYQELLNEHQGETNQCLTQIDLDVHRTMPTNIFFGGDGQGVAKLRRLLVAFSWYNPACGYCQGMNNLAATLLLTHATEEEAFWVLVCIIEKILPSEYYTSHLLVSQADQRVLIELVDELMPALSAHIAELGVDLPAVTFAWFLSLYTDCLPVETLFRVWDVMFVEGMVILFRVAIAILKMNESDLLATTSAAAFYGQVHSMTSRLFSVDRLINLACNDLKQSIRYASILEKRERHVADLTHELGLDTLPPQ